MIPAIDNNGICSFFVFVVTLHYMVTLKEDFTLFGDSDFGIGDKNTDTSVLVMERSVYCGTGRTFRGAVAV